MNRTDALYVLHERLVYMCFMSQWKKTQTNQQINKKQTNKNKQTTNYVYAWNEYFMHPTLGIVSTGLVYMYILIRKVEIP